MSNDKPAIVSHIEPRLAQTEPGALIARALEQKADPAVLEQMLALQERWEANQSKKAFVAATAAFKRACLPVLAKTATVDYTAKGNRVRYKWTPLPDIIEQVTPHLSANDLSVRWSSRQEKGVVEVTAILEHSQGHSEVTTLTAPHDQSGSKNQIQAVGSTVSYLMRYTLLQILGLATADLDDVDRQTPAKTSKTPRPTKKQMGQLEGLANEEMLSEDHRKKAAQLLQWVQRGQAVDVQPVIDELLAAIEPPEPGSKG